MHVKETPLMITTSSLGDYRPYNGGDGASRLDKALFMMNNCVQLLEKAENLKKELTHTRRNGLNGDGESTSNRAALQDLYRQLLITNLEYALDKKIEQELWNIVFKNHITALQQQTKDKANPKRTEIQNQLTVFLDASSGFYALLLQDLCHVFKINLPCRVRASKLSLLRDSDNIKRSSITQPERPSCQYMCQHCLVHLGDIARYRNQNGQAESYYRHAAQLVPSNGQPYNQLAILAAAGGDILSTAFYYCRSLAVKCPFPGSETNLKRQLSKIIDGEEPRHQKISTSELVKFYLKFHACIYLRKYDTKLEGMVKRLLGYMRAHLRTGSLSRKQLVHMAFLNLFSLNHLLPANNLSESGGKLEGNAAQENGMADDDDSGAPWNILVSFTVRMLGALLSCVPAYSDDSEDLEHPALPATKLVLDWLCDNISVLQNTEATLYGSVWQRFAKVLNALGNQDKANNMDNRPLPEDLEVRGFVGLRQSLSKLDFIGGYESVVAEEIQHPCRCFRLYQLGLTISRSSESLLETSEESDGTVFSCSLSDDNPSETEDEELLAALEKSESIQPTKMSDSNKPPRLQKDNDSGTTSILSSGDRSSGNKKLNGEGKKDRPRSVIKVAADNTVDSKLKSIQEEDSYHHDDNARSSTASSVDSTCSSPGNHDPPTHHQKSTHHVTFAPMPTRHSASPDHVSSYKRRSPSPDLSSQRNMPSPDSEYGPVAVQYSTDPRAHHQVQSVVSHGPIHPLQAGPVPIGVYQHNYPYPGRVVQAPPHVQYPVHGITQHIPAPGVAVRTAQLHSGPNPPPNPAELPKPLFPPQRMSFPPESAFAPHSISDAQSPNLMSGNVEDPMSMYQSRTNEGSSSSLARLAQLQQQQMAHLANPATVLRMQQSRPTNLGLAARFQNQPGIRFPPNVQQMKANQQIDAGRVKDSNLEAFLNHQRKAALQQQQQKAAAMNQYGFPDAAQTTAEANFAAMVQQQGMNLNRNQYSGQDLSMAYQYGQAPRNIFALNMVGQPRGSSPVGSNNTSCTSSPTPGVITSNTSPQAGSLPTQRAPTVTRFQNQADAYEARAGTGASVLLSQMMAQKQGQQPYMKSPTQPKPSTLFAKERDSDIGLFHTTSDPASVPPGRTGPILPSDIFGISPSTGGMSGFSVGSIGQSPANSSPSDSFPPYPLSQERQQIFDESLDMLEGRPSTSVGHSTSISHQRPNDNLSKATTGGQSERRRQFPGLFSKEDDEPYKLFPDTDSSWSLGRDNRNDNSLGLSNLGSIGSERAMAQQSHLPAPMGRLLWGENLTPSQGVGQQQPQRMQQPGIRGDSRFGSRDYPPFWSGPMMPSGPSALEQLIRQQQQHAGHDKTPP
ncbi:uncharacterized protein LOC120344245 [Styela clava]